MSGGKELPNSASGSQLSDRPALSSRSSASKHQHMRATPRPRGIPTPMEISISARVVAIGWASAIGPCLRRPLVSRWLRAHQGTGLGTASSFFFSPARSRPRRILPVHQEYREFGRIHGVFYCGSCAFGIGFWALSILCLSALPEPLVVKVSPRLLPCIVW